MRALTDLSLAFVDSLKRRRGGILNVASLAAFMPGPGRAVYYASKAYVLSFSEAPHRELKPHGVRVTVLCPGPVPTALQTRAGMTGFLPRLFMRSAEEVAREAYRGLSQGRRMVVPGFANRAVTTAIRLSPRSLWLELIARQQRRVPPSAPLALVAPHPALAATLSPLRGARVPRRLAFLRHLPQ